MAKVNIVMDMSQFDLFRLCECRFDYRYNKNKTGPNKAHQLDRGTLVHIGAEVYYEGIRNGLHYQDAVNAALSKIREAGVIATDLEPEAVSRVIDVMEEYFDYWRVEDQNLHITAVEQAFLYKLYEDDEITIHLSGKIDLIYSDNKHTHMPMDHKSYDRDFEVHRMSNQFKNYTYALTQGDGGELIVNRIGFQKTLKPHEKFKRPQLSYDKVYLQQWRQNVIKVIFHYLNCVAEDSWPMNETSCDKYHRKCEYFEVCDASGIEAKLYKLNANYNTVEPWDVSKSLRKASEVLEDAKKGVPN
jgi:PD-(D/E)XK nuclease superfamily protein